MTRKESAELQEKVADYIRRHEELTLKQMSSELGISVPYLSKIAIKFGQRRGCKGATYVVTADLLEKLAE